MEDLLIACKTFLLFCMDDPSRDIDHLKRFIEPLFWLCTWILEALLLAFEYLSLLFISTIFVHCGEKPRIPWCFKCLLHCDFPFIRLKDDFICIKYRGLCCGIPFKMGKWTMLINVFLKLCTLFCFLGHHFVVWWNFVAPSWCHYVQWLCEIGGQLLFFWVPSCGY